MSRQNNTPKLCKRWLKGSVRKHSSLCFLSSRTTVLVGEMHMNTSFTRNKGKSSAARRHFRAETMAAFLFCALFEPRDRYARMRLEDPRWKREKEKERESLLLRACFFVSWIFSIYFKRVYPLLSFLFVLSPTRPRPLRATPLSFHPLSPFTFFFRLWTRSTLFLSYRYRKRKKSISLIPRSSCFNMEGNTKVVTLGLFRLYSLSP